MNKSISRDFLLFILATACLGFAQSIIDSTFNNFLNERFNITNFQRTFLEFPREIPGLSVIFVSALFFFMCNRTLAAMSQMIAALGVFMIGFFSFGYSSMLLWLFVYSLGQHLFLPLTSDIGMELAQEGKTGKRLGQLQGAGNFAAIAGSFMVFLGFKYLHLSFSATFGISAFCFFIGALLIYGMRKNKPVPAGTRFKFRKEYKLFYILSVLYGTRKQIFLTFAPWILVTVFLQPTQSIAKLLTIGGVIGIVFKPILGRAIDKYGEKTILAGEAVVLIFVCMGYGFAKKFFSINTALLIASACFITDQLLMSVGMARATYLQKIALDPQELTSTLTAGVSIDHIFSISIALLGGLIWKTVGYEYIFLLGAVISLTNLYFALKIKTISPTEKT
ncbi:MAG: MFS transporter [Elusimicrobia bacterium]|nr:MFS transporter [Candidatus Liberimonas magnetica]